MQKLIVLTLIVAFIPALSSVNAESIYLCKKSGVTSFTNIKEESRGCKRVKVVVKKRPAVSKSKNYVAEVNFPKIDTVTQKKRDFSKTNLIRQELDSEKKYLLGLEEKLANFQIVSGIDQQVQINSFKAMNEERVIRQKNIKTLEKQLN